MTKRRRYYSLAKLLDAQPRGLVKDPRHRLMWDHFMASERLKTIRISRRCYNLLNNARIQPENIPNFYRTYRLPKNPFFPLFLAIKRDWLISRQEIKESRELRIMIIVKNVSPERRRSMRKIAEFEAKMNYSGEHPIWDKIVFPKTLKRARELATMDDEDWYRLWKSFFSSLSQRYPGIKTQHSRQLALLILQCPLELPGNEPGNRKVIIRQYRRLSKQHHPDHGGNPEYFRKLKSARDFLLAQL